MSDLLRLQHHLHAAVPLHLAERVAQRLACDAGHHWPDLPLSRRNSLIAMAAGSIGHACWTMGGHRIPATYAELEDVLNRLRDEAWRAAERLDELSFYIERLSGGRYAR